MNIAVVGAGVSGLTAAYYLDKAGHDITLFEANDYIGGHTDTHELEDGQVRVDSGFIVFNEKNYPHFTTLINELGVEYQESDMSFGVCNPAKQLEYAATDFDSLFCQRKNTLRVSHYQMIFDIFRFYREVKSLIDDEDNEISLEDYLTKNRYSQAFIEDHIYPMACALWSSPVCEIKKFPVRYLVMFMANHHMLQVQNRPVWKAIKNGSRSYVEKLIDRFGASIKTNTAIESISRVNESVVVKAKDHEEAHFDKVFIAAHSDQALAMLEDSSAAEEEILSAIPYQENQMVLHSDPSVMPSNRKAWASWNALVDGSSGTQCTVTYYMNKLQSLDGLTDYFVTLNPSVEINRLLIHCQRTYYHPIYTKEGVAAQKRKDEINGANHTYFCGAYWGWGFHEDGVRSAVESVAKFQQDIGHA